MVGTPASELPAAADDPGGSTFKLVPRPPGALSGVSFMRVQANHWLDYDAVALAVLVFGISAVTFLALKF